jgi:hypothetical protein
MCASICVPYYHVAMQRFRNGRFKCFSGHLLGSLTVTVDRQTWASYMNGSRNMAHTYFEITNTYIYTHTRCTTWQHEYWLQLGADIGYLLLRHIGYSSYMCTGTWYRTCQSQKIGQIYAKYDSIHHKCMQ